MSTAREAVMQAMRISRNETQLTRTIGELAGLDPSLPPQIARAVLKASAETGSKRALAVTKQLPGALTMHFEGDDGKVFSGRRPSGGRLDWVLANDSFRLVVEAKIGASLGKKQLQRYLAGCKKSGTAGGLVLLTSTAEEGIGTDVTGDDYWLGQIRWDQLLAHLAKVQAQDPSVQEEWRLLLSIIRQPGDLAEREPDWQLNGLRVGERNGRVLSAVRDRATASIATGLVARLGLTGSDGLCVSRPKPGTRSVRKSGDVAWLTLHIPAKKGTPVIEIMLTGTRVLRLTTSVDPGPPALLRRIAYANRVKRLADAGFEEAEGGWYEARDRASRTDETTTPVEAVSELLKTRLDAIVVSGVLDSLVPSRGRR